ncbi:1-phosphatidylinositol-3-phosphate 5-kinase, partial [Lunasporangiospora selenospora]
MNEENSMARDLTLGVRGSSYDSDGRSIRSFNSGHHKSNSLTKVMKRFRGDGVNRDFWMADENAKECFGCSLPFSVFRRRHHCRICGHIFCYKCSSNNIPGAKLGRDGNQRVCSYCLEGMEEDEELENGAIEHPAVPTWQNASPSAIHSHYSQQPSISPSVNSAHQDVTPLDGFRKLLNAGSLFLARSRSNTAAGDQVMDGGSVPFRRSLVLEDGSMHDSVLDPEIAPFMGDEDEDDQLDLWTPNPPHSMGFLSANSYDRDWDSEEEAVEQIVKDKSHLRNSRTDDPRGMFSKDRSPVNRRISMNGTRPSRNLSLSLKSRSLLRSEVVESLRSPMDARPSSPYLGASSQSLLHTGRHSRAASMVTNAPELNSASLQHMRRLLRQLLIRFEINDKDGWDDVIIKLVLKVSTSIQTLGVMDVMELVKIKKIPGGTAQDTLYINGVVCTKNLAHKQMSRSILNPKILILRFALEYQRVENHFTSLDPILNQEKEYLQNLVTRIAALGPRLLIVEKTVSRLALNLLLDHKIAVAYNVKPVVTEAIAHSTGAEIILSFDKLVKEPRLGTCSLFEIKTFVHNLIPNKRKSYMFFQDCPGNLFCSLVLRGGSLEMLNRIKKVVRLMVWVSYNLKLETSLMNDQFAMITAVQESTLAQEQDVKMSKDPDISQLQEMLKPYKHTILSASPFVVFEPPFLLSRLIEDAVELKKFEQPSTLSTLKDIGNSKILFTSAYSNAIVSKSSTGRSQDSGFIEGSYIDISNDYQSKSQAWGEFLSSNIPPSLIDPFNYQNLVFLYANVCTSTKTTCGTPHIRLIQYYYYETDLTLASYLVKTCFKSHFQCESCGRPLLDHQQIYAHGAAKVTVTLEPWESMTESKKDSIMMWSKCRICRVETPQIERSTISLYDINFPPMLVRCKPEYAARTKNQDLDLVRTLITRYWDSVMERIKNCIFDVVQPSKIEAAKQELLEMLRNVVLEKKGILQLLQQTYLNSAPTDTLALNMVRIKLYDRAVAWNKIFSDFARDYFNPDRDFRRSTAHHIRLLFDEKEFPMASDRAHHAVLMNDLPITLDSSNDIETSYEESLNFAPSDLPYLGSSPTLKVAKPKIEQGDVAALESAIETATSQIVFPFMEPKVTRRLSMNLMQEFRPKIAPTQPLDSSPTSSDESQDPKPRIKSSIAHSMIPRLPSSARHTSRVTSRLSTVTMPSFDPMSLLQQERKEGQESLLSSKPSSGIITSVSIHTGAPASPQSSKTTADRFIIPLDRTPTNERPSSAASSSSGKNPYFFTKPRPRRPTETPSSSSSLATSPVLTDKQMAPTNTLTSTTLSARRSTYLAKAHGGGIPNTSSNNVQSTVVTNAEPGRNTAGNRSRSMTQPIPGPSGGARTRYLNAISNRHHPRPLESKQPSIEVFSSVKEAAKEESDDEDEYQSGSEGDEPFHPSRGYKFSLVQTDAMDEALGSEDPKAMEAAVNSRTTNDNYSTSVMDDNTQIEPIMMFLGEDDPLPLDKPQDQHFAGTAGNGASSSGSGVGGSSAASNNGNHSTTVGSPPSKSSTMNMTVSGTLSAALAAAKLPQLSEVAEGVERGGSIMKTLSTFWQDRNYLNFTPLDFPMQPFEHVFSYSQIIIREDEPSSIIALTLSSPSYVEKLGELFRGESLASINATATSNSGTATPAEETVGGSYDSGNSNTGTTPLEGIYDDIPVYDDSMLLEPGTHMKIPFVDGSTSLYCKVFYMEQFHALRKAAGCEYSYIQSLARCMKWDANGGKSGSSFLKTRDDRFIMKQLSKIELEAFIKFAPHYFQYMQKAYYHK